MLGGWSRRQQVMSGSIGQQAMSSTIGSPWWVGCSKKTIWEDHAEGPLAKEFSWRVGRTERGVPAAVVSTALELKVSRCWATLSKTDASLLHSLLLHFSVLFFSWCYFYFRMGRLPSERRGSYFAQTRPQLYPFGHRGPLYAVRKSRTAGPLVVRICSPVRFCRIGAGCSARGA